MTAAADPTTACAHDLLQHGTKGAEAEGRRAIVPASPVAGARHDDGSELRAPRSRERKGKELLEGGGGRAEEESRAVLPMMEEAGREVAGGATKPETTQTPMGRSQWKN
jgi:hypothetical protein